MNPHVVSMDAADFTVMFVFLALQMFVFKLRFDWIWLARASDRKSTVSKQNQTHTEYAVGKQKPEPTHTQREACETSIPNFGCGWGPRTTSASGSLLRYQTAPATKPTKTAR